MTPTTILLCGCSADESSEEERGSSHMSFSPLGPFFPHYAKKCPFPIPHHSRVPVKSLTPSSISEGAQGLLISLVVTCLSPFAQISTHFATIAVSYQLLPPLKFPSPSKTVLCLPPLRHRKALPLSLSLRDDPFHSDTDSLIQTARTCPFRTVMD